MNHAHSHAHDHHDHAREASAVGRERKLLFAFVLTAGMMLAEAAGGWWSGSLALLADAGHMLVDAAALLLALFAARMARRPADARRTYGHRRYQPLAAFVNGQALLDLCYTEDVAATVDMNLVMNSAGEFIELQGSGEESTFSEKQLADLLVLGKAGIRSLLTAQQAALA